VRGGLAGRLTTGLILGIGVVCAPARGAGAQLPAPPASSPNRIHAGGYAAVVLRAPEAAPLEHGRITEAVIAGLVSGSITPRLTYFVEVEGVSSSHENFTGRQEDEALALERLYAEYTVRDAFRLRVGRFLTPIGQWNELHAEPLTWTSVRPLATYRSFAKSTTGLLAAGEVALGTHDAGYALYAAPLGSHAHDPDEVEFARAFGGRAAIALRPGVWLGASAASLRETRPRMVLDDDPQERGDEREEDARYRYLGGIDARVTAFGVELLAEATYLSSADTVHAERGGFVQVAAPIVAGFHAVGRVESFSRVAGHTIGGGTIGLTWRGPRGLTLKLERQMVDDRPPAVAHGWFLSASTLF
jgi:hypothetical protein